jgi:hypothetical protein
MSKLIRQCGSTILAFVGATLLAASATAAPIELVKNGGFETGNLTNWNRNDTSNLRCASGGTNWNVSTSGAATNCVNAANPSGSTYAAYAMNDGPTNTAYKLFQDLVIPLGTFSGAFSFSLSSINTSDASRTLAVRFLSTSGVALNTIYSASTSSNNAAWTTISRDVSTFLKNHNGQTLRLEFANTINTGWTGGAGIGIDNVSLKVNVNAVPEPASMALLGLGAMGLVASRRKRTAQRV